MDTLFRAVILIAVAAQTALLVYAHLRRRQVRTGRIWLALALLLALCASAFHLLPAEIQALAAAGQSLALALMALLVVYGALVIKDLRRQPADPGYRLWLLLGVIWLAGLLAAALVAETADLEPAERALNLLAPQTLFDLILLVGLVTSSIGLLGLAFHTFYVALLPEVANRALFWVLDTGVVIVGILLAATGGLPLASLGAVTLLVGMTGAVYGQVSYRVFDIRVGWSAGLRTAAATVIMAGIIFIALRVAGQTGIQNMGEGVLLLAALSLIVALLYVPVRRLSDAALRPFLRTTTTSATQATRRYSALVSSAVELDQLVRTATTTLNEVLQVRRSLLLLVNDTRSGDAQIELRVMSAGAGGDNLPSHGYLSRNGPVYQRLAAQQMPLSQFDLEFSPAFQPTPEPERQFFAQLQMSAFAPIIVENTFIGILACGPKLNDSPLYWRELELLATLANQTGVALRNARLVADLRHLNRTMQSLNIDLEEVNAQLKKLDSVKTEFVTIASHELRTPLAQLRGYIDILDSLNEQGMLTTEQTARMVGNLRKAAERMDELITAMLDVSQLDVNAMDLRFAPTTVDSIIRMAIEPLTDAIKQRKLTLSARGLRGLPAIEADMQRLVQAFRNVVINAIKFTPDGGRIEITASHQPAERPEMPDHILVAITDTGVGIAPENLDLIFQKFFRAYDPGLHSTGTYKFMGAGPGLGLTIARGVIEAHGGRIWAESPGHSLQTYPGSTFYVLLPLTPPASARRVMMTDSQPASASL